MEIVVRVLKDRKCSASLDWNHPERGIAGWILSFGDLDKPDTDCEVALDAFQIANFREMINKVDFNSPNSLPEVRVVAKPLDILVKVAEKNLPSHGLSGEDLGGLNASIFRDKDRNCWLLNFYDFHIHLVEKCGGTFNIWIQIEFSSSQLAELKGMLNALHAEQEREIAKRKAEEQERNEKREVEIVSHHWGNC